MESNLFDLRMAKEKTKSVDDVFEERIATLRNALRKSGIAPKYKTISSYLDNEVYLA